MKKILAVSILSLATLVTITLGYVLHRMTIQELILCSEGQGGIRIPEGLCSTYLFHFRGTPNDISSLSEGAGLSFILNDPENSQKKYRIATFLIHKGLDVNDINHYGGDGFTPLHSAVVSNELPDVKYLLQMGANIELKDDHYRMTPLELGKHLQALNPKIDRSAVIDVLENAHHVNG